ncbi:MAG: flagellar biosynthetic protein FliO [Candidatus Hydrogenedentes bacterium]|nr:flagellar biosynthetic protein FliO [Candidatus Hydrogenedentota bacterium]
MIDLRRRMLWTAVLLLAVGTLCAAEENAFKAIPPPEIELPPVAIGEQPPRSTETETPATAPAPGPASSTAAAASPAVAEQLKSLQQLYQEGPPSAEAPAGGGIGTIALLRTVMWLCVLCAAIIFGLYLLRKYARRTPLLAGQDLGVVLGRVYLNPKTSIHFVKTGGRVLLIGVTPQQVSLLSEFDAAASEELAAVGSTPAEPRRETVASNFLAELQANNAALRQPIREDDDLVSLRSDIQRLQQSLQEKMRETHP